MAHAADTCWKICGRRGTVGAGRRDLSDAPPCRPRRRHRPAMKAGVSKCRYKGRPEGLGLLARWQERERSSQIPQADVRWRSHLFEAVYGNRSAEAFLGGPRPLRRHPRDPHSRTYAWPHVVRSLQRGPEPTGLGRSRPRRADPVSRPSRHRDLRYRSDSGGGGTNERVRPSCPKRHLDRGCAHRVPGYRAFPIDRWPLRVVACQLQNGIESDA